VKPDRTYISEEYIASSFRVERIAEEGKTLALTNRLKHCEEM
jgi:hypothetical protein